MLHGTRHMVCSAIGQIVSVHHREHDIGEVHPAERAAYMLGLTLVHDTARITAGHSAETAATCARVAEDHQRGRACAPALADIWAACFLANGVKLELAEHPLQLSVLFATGEWNFQPWGFAFCDRQLEPSFVTSQT
jgi:hypothetical protein